MIALTIMAIATVLMVVGGFGGAWPYRLGYVMGGVGAVLNVVSGVWLYRMAQPYVHHFAEADWQADAKEGGFRLDIPRSRHGKTLATVDAVQEKVGGRFETVICDVHADGQDVVLRSGSRIVGRAIIK